jgi:hypothetical protein
MYVSIAELGRDLDLENANDDSNTDRIQVDCSTFKKALKVTNKVIKYLGEKGYKQGKLDCGHQRQGADYEDDTGNGFSVTIRWGTEVHILQY